MSRRAALMVGAMALLSSTAWLAETDSLAAVPSAQFAPPAIPLTMTRTIWRGLADGKQIMVRRTYAVQFVAEGSGFRLDGKLVDAQVEAPPLIAALADIERRRPDSGMFPVMLSASGAIVAEGQPDARDMASRAEMLKAAQQLVGASTLKPAAKQDTLRYLPKVQSVPGTPWPGDLFRPALGEHRQRRKVELPTGDTGEVEVTTRITRVLPGGIAADFERIITTYLKGHVQTSRELWTFAPAEP